MMTSPTHSALTRSREPRWALRWMAGAVAAVCLLSQVSGLLHMVLVPHVRCADHGELVHAGELSHAGDGVEPERAAVAQQPAASVEHGHEHCGVLAHRRDERGVLAAAAAVRAGVRGGSEPAVLLLVLRPSAVATYLVAPKNSPPV